MCYIPSLQQGGVGGGDVLVKSSPIRAVNSISTKSHSHTSDLISGESKPACVEREVEIAVCSLVDFPE